MKDGAGEASGRTRLLRTFLILVIVIMPFQIGATLAIRSNFSGTDPKDYEPTDYVRCYKPAAESIAHGTGPFIAGKVLTLYPVGYPAYLAILIKASEATAIPIESLVVGMNFLCNLVTMSGAFLLAYRIGGVRPAAIAMLLAGLCPNILYLSASCQPQIPYWALMVWCLYLLYTGYVSGRLWLFAAVGVLLGIGGLLRIETLTLLGIFSIYLAFSPTKSTAVRLARPAIILAAFILVVSPWIAYLYSITGHFIPLSSQTLSVGTRDPDGVLITGTAHLTALEKDPAGHTIEILKRAAMAWYHTDTGSRDLHALAMNLPYVVLTVIGFVAILAQRRLRWVGGLALITIVAIWVVSTLTFFVARLTVGCLVLFAFVPAVGVVWTAAKLRIWPPPCCPPKDPCGGQKNESRTS
jgi:hypothetical protein